MALLGDDTHDIAAYTAERATSPELIKLRDRVRVVARDDLSGGVAVANVQLSDGRKLSISLGNGLGPFLMGLSLDKTGSYLTAAMGFEALLLICRGLALALGTYSSRDGATALLRQPWPRRNPRSYPAPRHARAARISAAARA
jgi:hypothetical protein